MTKLGAVLLMTIAIALVSFVAISANTSSSTDASAELRLQTTLEGPQQAVSGDPGGAEAASGRSVPSVADLTNLSYLTNNASFVFVGVVEGQTVTRDYRDLIVTQHTFHIEEYVTGAFSATQITLTTLGGTIGEEMLSVAHMPQFELNQRYVVFVADASTYSPTISGEKGVFLVGGADGRVYTTGLTSVTGVTTDGQLQLQMAYTVQDTGSTGMAQGSISVGGSVASATTKDETRTAENNVSVLAMPLADFVSTVRMIAGE